ncbi:MAG TPA: 2-phospho-L-lactate transferase [Stellaceae bacterium]|nr:2-phospho-L-lactate transferase [Stellaceae bacterium]
MSRGAVLALSGGIGGAKLALGLSRVLRAGQLTVVANTSDDFEHLGLSISPDLDTLMYTLAGLDNPETGWGRRGETWSFMAALDSLGGETWFKLGDGDLAVHVERTRRLRAGERLTAITHDFCRRLGIGARLLPMSDDRVRTRLGTSEGWLEFQEYFVHRRCAPKVREIEFAGAAAATANPAFLAALAEAQLRAVVICPSNPFISVDPILALPGVRAALAKCRAPVLAISPIIGGQAVKGPTAKMMGELGLSVSAVTVARHYREFLDGFVLDEADAPLAPELDMPFTLAKTLMRTLEDREALARRTLKFAGALMEKPRG